MKDRTHAFSVSMDPWRSDVPTRGTVHWFAKEAALARTGTPVSARTGVTPTAAGDPPPPPPPQATSRTTTAITANFLNDIVGGDSFKIEMWAKPSTEKCKANLLEVGFYVTFYATVGPPLIFCANIVFLNPPNPSLRTIKRRLRFTCCWPVLLDVARTLSPWVGANTTT